MTGFLIKKAFFDGWDNLIKMVLLNIGFLLSLALSIFLPAGLEPVLKGWSVIFALPGILLGHVYAGAVSSLLRRSADYQSMEIREIPSLIKKVWKGSLVLGVINTAALFLFLVAFPFYLSMGGVMGAIGAGVIFWMGFFWLMAAQYFLPLYTRMENSLPKTIKKCFLLLLDNPGFSFFLLAGSLFIVTVSVFTASILPGLSGLLFWHQDALKLRLYKYDWLEENPGKTGKDVPWDILLMEDRESVGPRSLKGMIFPWKE